MSLNQIRIRIESKKRNRGNYIKNNAVNLCRAAQNCPELTNFQKENLELLLSRIENASDPWCWSGIAKQEETLEVLLLLDEMEKIIG